MDVGLLPMSASADIRSTELSDTVNLHKAVGISSVSFIIIGPSWRSEWWAQQADFCLHSCMFFFQQSSRKMEFRCGYFNAGSFANMAANVSNRCRWVKHDRVHIFHSAPFKWCYKYCMLQLLCIGYIGLQPNSQNSNAMLDHRRSEVWLVAHTCTVQSLLIPKFHNIAS